MVKKPTGKKSEYRDFILGMRDQINRRVNSALVRFPNYRLEAVRSGFEQCFHHLYDANTKTPQSNFTDIFNALLNLFLLAVGVNYYTGSDTPIRQPYLDPLFNTVFPRCLPLLSASPYGVPAMLFNACEYVGERAGKFLDSFTRILDMVDLGNFTNLVQLLLWLLGDPRWRQLASTTLESLPETTKSAILNQLFGISCDSGHILAAIKAVKEDLWVNPSEYLRLCLEKPPMGVTGETHVYHPINTCRLRYGSFTGFKGIYDVPPKIAGYQKGCLITYTPTGKLFFSMLDGIGSWEKSIPIPSCRKIVHPSEDACFGITIEGKLMNLRSRALINLVNVRECVDLFAYKQDLFVVAKSSESLDSLLKFPIEWAKNPTTKTQKTRKNQTAPITFKPLPAQPYHLCVDPNQADALLLEFYKKETMDYQLVRAVVNQDTDINLSTLLYEQKEPYLFLMQNEFCHIIHADGSYARYNPECTKADLTMKLQGLTHPTSIFLIKNNEIFATSRHSFHLFGFLFRPPESGVPAEINLISRS